MRFKHAQNKSAEQSGRRRASTERLAPPAFSYYARGSASSEPERRRRTTLEEAVAKRPKSSQAREFARKRFGLLVIAVAVMVCLVNVLRLSPDAKIDSLNTPEASYLLHSQQTYAAATKSYFADSLFNSNKLTVNTVTIEDKLLHEYPELTSAKIALPLAGHRPVMYIRTAAPRFILVSTSGQSYVIDENGKALLPTMQVPHLDSLKLPVIRDESGLRLERGHTVLSRHATTLVGTILDQLAAAHVSVTRLTLPAAANQLNVYPAGAAYYVKFNLQSDSVTQQTGTYLATARYLDKAGKKVSEYIDVRVDGRAYYK